MPSNVAKKRRGLNLKAPTLIAQRAFDKGIPLRDTAGRFRSYLDGQCMVHRKGGSLQIWGEHVWIFQNVTLITILYLPHQLKQQARRLRQELA